MVRQLTAPARFAGARLAPLCLVLAWIVPAWIVPAWIVVAAGMIIAPQQALAFSIELNDIAPMRIEWQRKHARGELPLPGTPDVSKLRARLNERGLAAGSAIFIRVFKAESELEIWIRKGARYVLFETYPICHWSGSLGPKLKEGDKQNPEGFYAISRRQLRHWGSWPKSFKINFPNRYDRVHKRTGSYILVHGGCSSVGCFAMTNPVMKEIHLLAKKAMRNGQDRFQLHIYPFRMTDDNLNYFSSNKWYGFWQSLKAGYDNFERTKVPPKISVCGKRYLVEDAGPDEIDVLARMKKLRAVSFDNASADDRCVTPPPNSRPARPEADGSVQASRKATRRSARHVSTAAGARF